jgi:hypothetical protein
MTEIKEQCSYEELKLKFKQQQQHTKKLYMIINSIREKKRKRNNIFYSCNSGCDIIFIIIQTYLYIVLFLTISCVYDNLVNYISTNENFPEILGIVIITLNKMLWLYIVVMIMLWICVKLFNCCNCCGKPKVKKSRLEIDLESLTDSDEYYNQL